MERDVSSSGSDSVSEERIAMADSPVASGSADAAAEGEESAETTSRRQRHRDAMARYRRRKKAGLSEMKVEEQFLVAQLQSMLGLHASQSRSYQADRPSNDDSSGNQEFAPAQHTPMDNFVQVLTESEHLRFENVAIQQRLEAFYKSEATLRIETKRELHSQDSVHSGSDDQAQKPAAGSSTAPSAADSLGFWVTFAEQEPPFFFVRYTQEECEAYTREARTKLELFISNQTSVRNVKLFDWSVSTAFEWDDELQATVIRFSFHKTFRNQWPTLEGFVDCLWQAIHDTAVVNATQSTPRGFQVLQTFGDNLSVVIWSPPDPGNSLKNRAISVCARSPYTSSDAQDRPGFVVTKIGVPPKIFAGSDDTQPPPPLQTTSKGELVRYISGSVTQTVVTAGEQDGDVDVDYSGRALVLSDEQGRFLMVELGNILIRMETRVFAMRVLSAASDEL